MPWWAAGYFGIYVAFSAWALYDDHRARHQTIPEAFAIIASDVLLIPTALSFWVAGVRIALANFIVPMYAIGVLLLGAELVLALRRHVASDLTFSFKEKIGVGGASAGLALAMVAPLLLWGFRAAVLGEHVDA